MKRERCLNERIASALRQAEGGTAMEGICRKVGVSEAMFTRCKKQFAGMGTVEIWRLQQLEEEKAKLKRLVAGLEPGRDHAAGWSRKRMLKPGVRREGVGVLQGAWQVSGRSSQHYRFRRNPQVALRMRPKDFMSDQLFDSRPIRILTIVDIHTREGLSTTPRANFRAAQGVEVLDQPVRLRGKPKSLRVDNGPDAAGCRAAAGPPGTLEPGWNRLLQAGQSNGQRLHRGRSMHVCGRSA